jgi:hypothetical protein
MPLVIAGATSGSTTVQATDAVTATITLPSATDTLVGKATTDTLTNKTLTLPVVGTTIGVGGATPSASGAGITFPATQSASTNANTLDDYEEGTWTPVLSSAAGSITSQTCSGRYTKIGRVVTVYAFVQINNPGTASGAMLLSGLPFAAPDRANAAIVREDANFGFAYMFVTNANATTGFYFTLTTNLNPPYTTNNLYPFTLTYQI